MVTTKENYTPETKDKRKGSEAYCLRTHQLTEKVCMRGEKITVKQPEDNDISKHKFSRREKITNIWAKINKTESKKTTERTNNAFFGK